MKIIVAGSRTFGSLPQHKVLLYNVMDKVRALRNNHGDEVEVVCGEARGADTIGLQWANSRGLTVHHFPAKWDKLGKAAGYQRNREMADFSDAAVVFWDGISRGSKHMIDLAKAAGLITKVIHF